MSDSQPLIQIDHLVKKFGDQVVLNDISETINQGDVIVIIGASGGGKSTFLRSLNLLNKPTSGSVKFEGTDLTTLSEKDLDKVREKMGMVFQQFNLFPNMTVLDNIKLAPMKVKAANDEEATKKAKALLDQVGLDDKANEFQAACLVGRCSVSPLRGRWPWSRTSCCLTNRPQHLIRKWSAKS